MQLFDDESEKGVFNVAESIESGEISSSSSEYKIGKPIGNHLDLFIITCLNQMSIRSRLVSQPENELISNSE